jgi:hypothetical protein
MVLIERTCFVVHYSTHIRVFTILIYCEYECPHYGFQPSFSLSVGHWYVVLAIESSTRAFQRNYVFTIHM